MSLSQDKETEKQTKNIIIFKNSCIFCGSEDTWSLIDLPGTRRNCNGCNSNFYPLVKEIKFNKNNALNKINTLNESK